MKILHTADWHLSSPITCKLSPEAAEMRRGELVARFADMVRYAAQNGISAVLLCGDIGDRGILPFALQDYLCDTIGSVPEIRFFLVSGNHDRIPTASGADTSGIFTRDRRPLPDNLTLFSDTWKTVSLGEGVTISGLSFDGSAPYTPPVLSPDTYNIVCLHGNAVDANGVLGGEGDNIPLPVLAGKNVNYLALGHYHAHKHGTLDRSGIWCYSGCPEGRGFDECGERGFVVLSVDANKKADFAFVPFAKRHLHIVPLDITDVPAGLLALEGACDATVAGIPATDLVRLSLCGEDLPEATRNIGYLARRLSEKFYYAEVEDKRRVKRELDFYRHDLTLRGEFVRSVLSSPLSDTESAEILRLGLAALEGSVTE